MAKNRKIISAGIGYTVGNYFIKGLSFLTIPIFARILEKQEYGFYNSYIAYESIICIIIGLALHSSFKNAKYKFNDGFNKYVSDCVTLGIFNAGLCFIVLNAVYRFAGPFLGVERWLLNLLLVHSFGSALIQYYNAYVGLYYEYAKFIKLSLFNAIINVLGSLVLILFVFKEQKYYGRIIGAAFPVVIIGIYVVVFFFKKAKPNIDKEKWKYALMYSLPIIPHGISQVILSQFDRIMITRMAGAGEAGIYSFAYNVYTIIQVTGNSLSNVWEPWFFEKMQLKDYKSIRKKGFLFGTGMLVFSAVLCLVSPEVILILGTSKYSESIYCVIPIIVGGYFSFLYILPCEIEYYHEKTRYIAIATSIAAGLNIILNYVFINYFGYIAAAYTTLATYLFYFIFHYFMARKIEGRYIYSNLQIFLLITAAIVICIVSLLLIRAVFVRWGLAVFTIMTSIFFINKRLGFIQMISEKIIYKR